MRIQVAELLLEMIDYLNRNGCEGPEIPKESQNISQIDHEIEEYVSDIKRLFTDKLKEDPATRKNVDKLLQKKAKIAVVE